MTQVGSPMAPFGDSPATVDVEWVRKAALTSCIVSLIASVVGICTSLRGVGVNVLAWNAWRLRHRDRGLSSTTTPLAS